MAKFLTYTLRDVASLIHKSPNDLWRMIRAASDPAARKRRRISERLLRRYPVEGWFRLGGRNVIREKECSTVAAVIAGTLRFVRTLTYALRNDWVHES